MKELLRLALSDAELCNFSLFKASNEADLVWQGSDQALVCTSLIYSARREGLKPDACYFLPGKETATDGSLVSRLLLVL